MNELESIVIVEDDSVIRTILEMMLKAEGFRRITSFSRGDEGMKGIERLKPDLVLLDLMLPGLDGLSICRRIRSLSELSDTRVIMITARAEDSDVVRGLDIGADDYVVKPFAREVLLARVKAVLRRGAKDLSKSGLVLNDSGMSAELDGKALDLTPGEYKILSYLVSHAGTVLVRTKILDAVQCDMRDVTERTIDVQMVSIRRKLGEWASHIETVRGVGYRVKL